MTVEQLIPHLETLAGSGATFQTVLEAAVHGVHQLDPRFHWTGIYELFPDNVLRLGPFIGVGRGVCGTAVAEKRNMNIPDVSRTPNYLACSSDTRSELVVLIRRGETIFAQIDIDSHELAAFDAPAVDQVERVADWLARYYAARSASPGQP